MCNTYLRSGGSGLLGVVLGNSFLSAHGTKLGLTKGSVGGTMVDLEGGEPNLAALGQGYVI